MYHDGAIGAWKLVWLLLIVIWLPLQPPALTKLLRHQPLVTIFNCSPQGLGVATNSWSSWRDMFRFEGVKHAPHLDISIPKQLKACYSACALPLSRGILSRNWVKAVLRGNATPSSDRPNKILLENHLRQSWRDEDKWQLCRNHSGNGKAKAVSFNPTSDMMGQPFRGSMPTFLAYFSPKIVDMIQYCRSKVEMPRITTTVGLCATYQWSRHTGPAKNAARSWLCCSSCEEWKTITALMPTGLA